MWRKVFVLFLFFFLIWSFGCWINLELTLPGNLLACSWSEEPQGASVKFFAHGQHPKYPADWVVCLETALSLEKGSLPYCHQSGTAISSDHLSKVMDGRNILLIWGALCTAPGWGHCRFPKHNEQVSSCVYVSAGVQPWMFTVKSKWSRSVVSDSLWPHGL